MPPIAILLLLSLLAGPAVAADLYGILGLRRSSSDRDVKRAYKRLALKWHPDRNKSPEAKEKFIQIQQAYDVLSDPAKRRDYDVDGRTPEERARRPAGPQANPFMYGSPYGGFFGQWYVPPIPSDTTELRSGNWQQWVGRPPRQHSPSGAWLVHFYHVHSPLCHQVSPLWEEAARAVRSLAGAGRVNAELEPALCRRYGVANVPAFLLLTANGSRWATFDGPLTRAALVGFVTAGVAHRVEVLRSAASLALWRRVRPHTVKAVLFADKDFVSPLFAALSYQFTPLMDFGVVPKSSTLALRQSHNITAVPTLVLFKGGADVVRLSGSGLDKTRMAEVLRQHQLPRMPPIHALSFPHVCGAGTSTHCVILVTRPSSPTFGAHMEALRRVVESAEFPLARFAWVDASEQQPFLACYPPTPHDVPTILVLRGGSPSQYGYLTPSAISPPGIQPLIADLFSPTWQWRRSACVGDPQLQPPTESWDWDTVVWRVRRTANRLWEGPWPVPSAATFQYLLLPLLLLPLLWGREDRRPQRPPSTLSPAAAARPPADAPAPASLPHSPLPLLSPGILDHPGYTVLVFMDPERLAASPAIAATLARAVQDGAGEGIWRFCVVPPTFPDWWKAFGASDDAGEAAPLVLAVRHRKCVFSRLPPPPYPHRFGDALRSWLDRLAGGEGRLEQVEAWPPL
eukprot:EG_transcript_5478